MKKNKPKPKGFAAMTVEQRTEIARLGGKAVSKGPKGKDHMKEIAREGGKNSRKGFVRKYKRAA